MPKKTAKGAGRGSEQFVIRFPEGMRERLAHLAGANGRSMNAELVHRLEASMAASDEVKKAKILMTEIKAEVDMKMKKLEERMASFESRHDDS
jgi:hypothetical protein